MTGRLVDVWRTNNRVMSELVSALPPDLWKEKVPGSPRTVRAIAAHIHNARCMWIKTLGREHGVAVPQRVDFRRATSKQVVAALKKSSAGMESLFALAGDDGRLPESKGYIWRNLSLDVVYVATYFIAHEAHHRGQLVMAARQLGHRLPRSVTTAIWQWKPR